jgi:hypothetical protein
VAAPIIPPSPAPVNVPMPAPFSRVVRGSEQPRKNIAKEIAKTLVRLLFISRSLEYILPFDGLRANGKQLSVIGDCPFMLSSSKHGIS